MPRLALALLCVCWRVQAEGQKRGEIKPPSSGGGRQVKPPSSDAANPIRGRREDLDIERVKEPEGGCGPRARPGDTVSVMHKGFLHDVPEGEDRGNIGKQFDGNIQGEPLKFKLRTTSIIVGMDLAIEGMCVGETIRVVIPPLMAFDNPNFKWSPDKPRPVPPGSQVRYEITLEGLEQAPGATLGTKLAFGFLALMVVCICLVLRKAASKKKPDVKAKDKDKKKRK